MWPRHARLATITLALALVVLAGCGTSTPSAKPSDRVSSSAAASASSVPGTSGTATTPPTHPMSPSAGPTTPRPTSHAGSVTVRLAAGFAPSRVRLRVGEQLRIQVATTVIADIGTTCGGGGAKVLERVCGSAPAVRYVARAAGTTTLDVMVRPKCRRGVMCPKWISRPTLTVVVT